MKSDEIAALRAEAESFAYQPCISIVTPVFNTPVAWLTECVESVLAQAYEKWELILVDDDSTDPETLKVLRELGARDSRIVLAKDEKSGVEFPPPQIAVSPSRKANGWAFSITMMFSNRMRFFKTSNGSRTIATPT